MAKVNYADFKSATNCLIDDRFGYVNKEALFDCVYKADLDFNKGVLSYLKTIDGVLNEKNADDVYIEIAGYGFDYSLYVSPACIVDHGLLVNEIDKAAGTYKEVVLKRFLTTKEDYVDELKALLDGDMKTLALFGHNIKEAPVTYLMNRFGGAEPSQSGYSVNKSYGSTLANSDEAHTMFYRDSGVEYIISHSGDAYIAFKDELELVAKGKVNNCLYEVASNSPDFPHNKFTRTDAEYTDIRNESIYLVDDEPDKKRNKLKV